MAARFEPETWQDILIEYQRTVRGAIENFGGYIARVVGDGILIYFGWPIAHEDDGERAVRAGLRIVNDIRRLGRIGPHGGTVDLHVRIAAHSGMTLVDDAGEAYGETPHLAARAQAAAPLDSVVVTETLRIGPAGRFPATDLGLQSFKGIARHVRLFAVDPAPANERTGTRAAEDVAGSKQFPLIGRDEQRGALRRLWSAAVSGHGQSALLLGEPGIGKSRLIEEFKHIAGAQPHRWIDCAASAFRQVTPFYPLIQALKNASGMRETDSPEECFTRLERMLERARIPGRQSAHLLAELLGVKPEDDVTRLMSMAERRQRQNEILVQWISGNENLPPTAFVLEDIHWCDTSALELLSEVQQRIGRTRLLVLLTGRPEASSLPIAAGAVTIALPRLHDHQAGQLLTMMTATAVVSDETRLAIIRRSEGVPLFVEEFARLSTQGENVGRIPVPTTLAASVLSRLAQLGQAQQIAHACAVIGAPVSLDFLGRLVPLTEAELLEAINQLVGAQILVFEDERGAGSYRLGHALLRDITYGSLLSSRRRALHRDVAHLLQRFEPRISELQPEVMARHWSEANEPDLAIAAWSSAGLLGVQRRAFSEARDCYRAALELLTSLPETVDRDRREIEIRYALFAALQITAGYSADELSENTTRARQLTEKSGDTVKLISLATGAWAALSSAGDYGAARRIADEISSLAARDGGPENLAHGHMVQITARSRTGDLAGAEAAFVEGEKCFDAAGFRRKTGAIAQTYGNAAMVAALQGRQATALERAQWALNVAQENNNPYDVAFANHMAAVTFLTLRLHERGRVAAQKSMSLSDEHDYPQFTAIARIALGRAIAELEDATQGVALIHQGLEAWARTPSRGWLTIYLVWLAEAQTLAQSPGNAFATLEKALAVNPEERLYRPEALRLRGLLRFQKGDFDMAERDLRDCLRLSKDIGAQGFVLRSAHSLADLNVSRGRPETAIACLEEALASRMLDPSELSFREAQALLDKITSRAAAPSSKLDGLR